MERLVICDDDGRTIALVRRLRLISGGYSSDQRCPASARWEWLERESLPVVEGEVTIKRWEIHLFGDIPGPLPPQLLPAVPEQC